MIGANGLMLILALAVCIAGCAGESPKPMPASHFHTPHIPPANPTLTQAPICVHKVSRNRKLKVTLCWNQ